MDVVGSNWTAAADRGGDGASPPAGSLQEREGRRGYASGRITRALLIDTAERLFAQRGIDQVSLRDIAATAGQRNSAAVTYHFGSKLGLLRAIVDHRVEAIGAERSPMVARLRDDGLERDPRAVLWALVKPLAGSRSTSVHYPAFIHRLQASGVVMEVFTFLETTSTAQSFEIAGLLEGLVRDLPEPIGQARVALLYDSMLQALAREARERDEFPDALLSSYIDAWAAMLTAPVSDETARLSIAT